MFDRVFVDRTQGTRKPFTLTVSLLFQIGAICLMILMPLLYTQTLASAQLKGMLVAPAPPPPASKTPVRTASRTATPPRALLSSALTAPRVIPRHLPAGEGGAATPDIGLAMDVNNGTGDALLYGSFGPAQQPFPPPAAPKARPPEAAIHVGSVLAEANLMRRVQPVYPPLARSARVQGSVEFTALISREGKIENLQLVHGHPLLVSAAREAILQWQYRPTMLNGQPVEVVTTILVNFTLAQ